MPLGKGSLYERGGERGAFWRFRAMRHKSISFTRWSHGTILMCTSAWL